MKVSPEKMYPILWFLLLSLFCICPLSFAADKQGAPTGDDLLKLLGHAPIASQAGAQKQITGTETDTTESDFKSPLLEHHIHTVKAGENLSSIVKQYYDDYKKINEIAEYNQIKNVNQLKVGQKIKIPVIELKQGIKVFGIKETNLEGAEEIKASSINTTDLKRKGILSKTIYLLVILLILAGFGLAVYIFLIKPPANKETDPAEMSSDDDLPTETPFILGSLDGEDR